MQTSNLPFAWLRISERSMHQQQDTFWLQILPLIWKQPFLASSNAAFFHAHLKTYYLDQLSNPEFVLLDTRQTGTSRSRTLPVSRNVANTRTL
ncbi:MAG: hypothetical protein RMY34_02650 [Aulosira sp. DedQUE10]|nr:hypothetical protein [Aulosira sp. DedQUE10]